ncbi:unnamed protein product, partial [Prorocentrum cordatum]
FVKDYVLPWSGTQPFFRDGGSDGEKLFIRHPLNQRRQRGTMRHYKKLILKQGVSWSDRAGDIVVQPTCLDPSKWILRVLGGATLLDACYNAIKDAPKNEQVLSMIDHQVPRVQLLNPNTPPGALYWIRVQCNKLVAIGSTASFFEKLELAPVVVAHWQQHRAALRKKRKGEGEAEEDGGEGGEGEGGGAEADAEDPGEAGEEAEDEEAEGDCEE